MDQYRRQKELVCDREQTVVLLGYLANGLDFTLVITEISAKLQEWGVICSESPLVVGAVVDGEHLGRKVRRLESESQGKMIRISDMERKEGTTSWVVEEWTHQVWYQTWFCLMQTRH